MNRRELTLDEYVDGVRGRDPAVLGRAVTLVESRKPEHRDLAQRLLQALLPHAGDAHRVGVTGVPGVGKSTFVDALGMKLVGRGHHVAVLAVDPSSTRTGGSILGDKTRMERLSTHPEAFIRPSPTAGTLGGVARATRETMVVVEAAGYDIVIVETVGVGQSETTVSQMVDFFCVLMLPGAGDQLQGIKKGVLEIADLIAVNKADGERMEAARLAAREYRQALHILQPASPNWSPPVLLCSALEETGLDELWEQVERHREQLTESGELTQRRRRQQVQWMWSMLGDVLMQRLRSDAAVRELLPEVEAAVAAGELTPTLAVEQILGAFSS